MITPKPCPQLSHVIGDEKVCYSGDVVRVDEDGILWFVSRADSMIKPNTIRVSPTEIEDVVYQANGVKHAVAFGIDDEIRQQVIHVAVELFADSEVETDALLAHCRRNLPPYMVPECFLPWPGPMPKTASGKLDRPTIIAACKRNLGRLGSLPNLR